MRGADWVIGRGLLGRAVARRIDGEVFHWPIDWSVPSASVGHLRDALASFTDGEAQPRRIYWCAGSGVTSTGADRLNAEVGVFEEFLAAIGELPDEVRASLTFFLASSVGGVYGGNPHPPYSELSATAPISAYGEAKLRMEQALERCVVENGVRGLVGRITNLYGPGQNLAKGQGLISVICKTYLTREPASIFVSMDTIRDYIFEEDCAAIVLAGVRQVEEGEDGGSLVIKIIGSENAVSIGELIGEIRRIRRRAPLIVIGSAGGAGQAPDLRVRSTVMPELGALVDTTLAAGIHSTFAAMSSERFAADARLAP